MTLNILRIFLLSSSKRAFSETFVCSIVDVSCSVLFEETEITQALIEFS